jgi:ubiquinone/menaquinone biosynthesis C-methylase UbiE
MGLYERYLFPSLMDRLLRDPVVDEIRAELLADAQGEVLEIGFGTGLNARHYPSSVSKVIAVEPNPGMSRLANERIAAARVPIELIAGVAEALPFDAGRFPVVLSTATLCSVQDLSKSLSEIRRVLAPGGTLRFVEHGLSDDPEVEKWQRRLNGLQRWLAAGCNLDRPMKRAVEDAGFRLEHVRSFYFEKAPKPHGYMTVGRAVV